MLAETRQFWLDNERNIVLILGFVLVAVISFEAGLLKGREIKEKPVVIEKTANPAEEGQRTAEDASEGANSRLGVSLASDATDTRVQSSDSQNCAYVGSKNSNKYHLPACRWAKNIKPENIVCFPSAEDAAAKGYLPDKNCIK